MVKLYLLLSMVLPFCLTLIVSTDNWKRGEGDFELVRWDNKCSFLRDSRFSVGWGRSQNDPERCMRLCLQKEDCTHFTYSSLFCTLYNYNSLNRQVKERSERDNCGFIVDRTVEPLIHNNLLE